METPMTPAASSAPSTMTCNMWELQIMRSLIVLIYTLKIEKLVIEHATMTRSRSANLVKKRLRVG
jgi:hypothetical protein